MNSICGIGCLIWKITSIYGNLLLAVIVISVIAESAIYGFLFLDPKKANAVNSATTISPRTILLDPSLLTKAKHAVNDSNNNNTILQSSLKQLLLQADSFLTKKPISVTQKTQLPASNDKHDYLSLSPYDWPDPTKPNGLPYILHDGIVNKLICNSAAFDIDSMDTVPLGRIYSVYHTFNGSDEAKSYIPHNSILSYQIQNLTS